MSLREALGGKPAAPLSAHDSTRGCSTPISKPLSMQIPEQSLQTRLPQVSLSTENEQPTPIALSLLGDPDQAVSAQPASPTHVSKCDFTPGRVPINVKEESSPFDIAEPYNPHDPVTWPTIYLPYHSHFNTSLPQHIDDLLIHVKYAGPGADFLQGLLYEAVTAMDTEEERKEVERIAFKCWPYNVTVDGYRKRAPRITAKELIVWQNMVFEP
ncbi:hypothetical protein ACN47E_000888 [Coniothyrium glycines]